MYKKILGCIFVFVMAMTVYSSVYADDNVQLEMNVINDVSEVKPGDRLITSFEIVKNTGFNSFTFFVDYDPKVLEPVEFDAGDDDDDGWIKISEDSSVSVITTSEVNKQFGVVPSANDSDFEGLGVDGIKTAAQLGRIKFSGRIYNSGELGTTEETGRLFAIVFNVVGSNGGNSEIKITPVNSGFAPIITKTQGELATKYNSAVFKVNSTLSAELGNVIYVVDLYKNEIVSAVTDDEVIEVPSVISDVTINSIGENAFEKCTSAKKITLPSSVYTIGKHAFSGCKKLEIIAIPAAVNTIDDYAFTGCDKLAYIAIPYRVKLGIGVFSDCSSLEKVEFY